MGGIEDILVPRGGSLTEGDDLPAEPAAAVQSGPFVCVFAIAPADDADLAWLTGGVFDTSRIGPARWVPRVDAAGDQVLPQPDDTALLQFDDNGDPWVVAWWVES